LGNKELIIAHCCQCPFLHHGHHEEQGRECYCFLNRQINVDNYYTETTEKMAFGFPEECPLFENDQIIVKRVRLRLLKSDSAKWEVKEGVKCADCGTTGRGYRLVYARDYDRLNEKEPEFRCEKCSIRKAQELKQRGIEL